MSFADTFAEAYQSIMGIFFGIIFAIIVGYFLIYFVVRLLLERKKNAKIIKDVYYRAKHTADDMVNKYAERTFGKRYP